MDDAFGLELRLPLVDAALFRALAPRPRRSAWQPAKRLLRDCGTGELRSVLPARRRDIPVPFPAPGSTRGSETGEQFLLPNPRHAGGGWDMGPWARRWGDLMVLNDWLQRHWGSSFPTAPPIERTFVQLCAFPFPLPWVHPLGPAPTSPARYALRGDGSLRFAVCGPGRLVMPMDQWHLPFGWIAAFTGAPRAISTAACTEWPIWPRAASLRPGGHPSLGHRANVGSYTCWPPPRWGASTVGLCSQPPRHVSPGCSATLALNHRRRPCFTAHQAAGGRCRGATAVLFRIDTDANQSCAAGYSGHSRAVELLPFR